MTTQALSVKAEVRTSSGKGVARGLRREDKIPGVIYSRGKDSILVSIPKQDLQPLRSNSSFSSTVIELELDGSKYILLAKQMSCHPVSDALEHVEFIDISSGAKVNVKIPIRIEGQARSIGLKKDGVINLSTRYLECISSNDNIPQYIAIDVANINIGDVVRLRDIILPDSVVLKTKNLDQIVLKISGKRAIKEDVTTAAQAETNASAVPVATADKKPDNKDSK